MSNIGISQSGITTGTAPDQLWVNGTAVVSPFPLMSLVSGEGPQDIVKVNGNIVLTAPEQLYLNGKNLANWPIDTLINGANPYGGVNVNGSNVSTQGPLLYSQVTAASITSTVLVNNIATYGCKNHFSATQLVTVSGCAATYNVTNAIILDATATQFRVQITNANIAPASVSGQAWVPAIDIRSTILPATQATAFMVSDFLSRPKMWLSYGNVNAGQESNGQTSLNIQAYGVGAGHTINFIIPAGGGGWSIKATGGYFIGNTNIGQTSIANGTGVIIAPSGNTNLAVHNFRTGASGTQGTWDMAQFTGTALAAPGSGIGRLEWLAGTVGGLKLVSFAGTSTVASTIADNVGNGRNQTVASVAYVDLTTQTASIGTTTLYAVPAAGIGEYRLSWNAKVTTAAGTSSTLGPLTITYTDPDGVVQTITCAAQSSAGTIETSDSGNTTTTVLLGVPILLNANSSTNISYAFTYASNAAAAMNYNLHLRLESM